MPVFLLSPLALPSTHTPSLFSLLSFTLIFITLLSILSTINCFDFGYKLTTIIDFALVTIIQVWLLLALLTISLSFIIISLFLIR
jgi:hypothetical protein